MECPAVINMFVVDYLMMLIVTVPEVKKQSTKQCGLRDVYMHRKTGMARRKCNSEGATGNFFFSVCFSPLILL